jgi:antitoxin MazE
VFDIIEATMQVSKWGNSLAVRLPKALVDELGLKEGDELNVVAAKSGTIEVETREDQRRRALERMAARNWTLPPDYKFNRDEANER